MLIIKNLTAHYSIKGNPILNNISLSFKPQTLNIIVGDNGVGKSSLFNAICGNMYISQGTILLNNQDMLHCPSKTKTKYINRIYQNALLGLCSNLTVEENCALYLLKKNNNWLKRFSSKKNKSLFISHFNNMELNYLPLASKPLSYFSGGQQQIIALAIATLTSRPLLLLDEHTASLDLKTTKHVLHLTKKITQKYETSVLMITHAPQKVTPYADQIIVMKKSNTT